MESERITNTDLCSFTWKTTCLPRWLWHYK